MLKAPNLPHTDTARLGIRLLPPGVGAEAGDFKYADNLIDTDAAIGGLMVSFISGYSLDAVAWAYSTGSAAGDVPATIGFAPVMYGWNDDAGSAYGLAVFGGQSATGVKTSNIWLGQFGGLNDNGVPFFTWQDATPLSGEMPPPRSGASMVFDESQKRLLMFGGTMERDQVADDIWEYDLVNGAWNQLDRSFLSLTDFALVQVNNRFYVAGGRDAAGSANTNVYRVGFTDLQPTVAADMANGPGARDKMSMGFESQSSGSLIFFGGTDSSGTDRNDLWKFDLQTSAWSQDASDCAGEICPKPGDSAFVIAGRGGRISVHTSISENGDDVFSLHQGGVWTGNRSFVLPMTGAMDCDGDGVREQETALSCRNSSEWYAEVGKMQCAEPGQSNLLECGAKEPDPMALTGSWSPGGWEWIVDLTEGPDDYTYVLTDDTLYTFDTLDLSSGLYPIDSDELIVPGSCWFCGGPDWSFDVEVHGDNAYVASWSGVHVFDLSDPEAPVEVGHFASYAPVIDMALFRGIAYLADGFGITVVSVADPTAPIEVERVPLGTLVEALGVNEESWRLMALTPGSLRKFSLGGNPFRPTETGSVGLAGWSFYEMKVEGRWTYLNGLWTQTVLDEGAGGFSTQGTHDLRAWVNGRILREDRAEHVRWLFNEFQVWEE